MIGKPLAELSWWTEQHLLKNTLTPLSEHRVRSDLIYGPLQREDHGRVFTCFAKNNEKTTPLTIDITIDMYCKYFIDSYYSSLVEQSRTKSFYSNFMTFRIFSAFLNSELSYLFYMVILHNSLLTRYQLCNVFKGRLICKSRFLCLLYFRTRGLPITYNRPIFDKI